MGRVLSSIGIGSATVETVLPKTSLHPGETVEVAVELTGGSADQAIDDVAFALHTDVDGEDVILDEFALGESFTLAAGESRTETTDLTVPPSAPLTRDGQRVHLETRLDIDWAVDPTDDAPVEVVPGERLAALLEAVERLGFEADGASTHETPWLDERGFLQALRFTPDPERWPNLDALTVMPVVRPDDLRVFVEIDVHEDAEETTEVAYDKQEVSITFDTTDVDMMRRRLKSEIETRTHV